MTSGAASAAPTRRQFLAAAAAAPQLLGVPSSALAQGDGRDFWSVPRWVWLKRPATGEEVRAIYWADGQLVQDGYLQLCWLLRDVRAGKSMYMSPILLDILYATCGWLQWFGIHRPITTTSGARFEATNRDTEGAAKNSLHKEGRAHDGFIEGVSVASMRDLGLWLGGGGVGYYPQKSFCHWDDGRARYWRG